MRLSPVVDSAVDKVIHSSPHLCPQVWTNDIGVLPQFPQGSTNLWKTVRRAGVAPSKLSTASCPQSAVHSWLSTVARPQTRSRSCAAPARRRVALGGDGPHRGRVMRRPRQVQGRPGGLAPPWPGDGRPRSVRRATRLGGAADRLLAGRRGGGGAARLGGRRREPTGAGRTESPARPWTASEAMRRDPLREGGIERAPPRSAAAPIASSPGPRRPL